MRFTMNLKDKLLNRIDELLDKDPHEASLADASEISLVVTNIFETIYGPRSPQLDMMEAARKHAFDRGEAEFYKVQLFVQSLQGYLRELKAAISEGRIVNIQSEAQGEVLGDFLVLARKALDEEEKDVAAVLACAALEDALKRYARDQGLNVQDKNMQTVVKALKSKGVIPSLQGKLLDGYVQIRNKTFHAQWEEIDAAAVNSIIGFTEIFLVQHFSALTVADSSADS